MQLQHQQQQATAAALQQHSLAAAMALAQSCQQNFTSPGKSLGIAKLAVNGFSFYKFLR